MADRRCAWYTVAGWDFYTESVAIGQRQASRGAAGPLPSPVEPTGGSSPANLPAPPRADESLRPELPQPPSLTATADGRAAGSVTDPPKEPSDSAAILDALRRYDLAYEALDVSGVLQVFPSLSQDQVEQLRRTFAAMTAYEIEIRNARVDVQGRLNGLTQLDSVTLAIGVGSSAWEIAGLGDMNGDHWPDLVWRDYAGGSNAVWMMQDSSVQATLYLSPQYVTDTNYRIVGVADIDGNGKPDLVWRHTASAAKWPCGSWMESRLCCIAT